MPPAPHAAAVARLKKACPAMKELILGEKFRPHRSVAAWYLWRANDLPK